MTPQGPSYLKRGCWRLESWLGLDGEELCGLWSQFLVGLARQPPGIVRTRSSLVQHPRQLLMQLSFTAGRHVGSQQRQAWFILGKQRAHYEVPPAPGFLYWQDAALGLAINSAINQACAHIRCLRAHLLRESHSPSYNPLY